MSSSLTSGTDQHQIPDALRAGRELAFETADARTALLEAASAAAEAAVRALSLVELLDEAVVTLAAGAPAQQRPAPLPVSWGENELSRREREVLALVAAGYTNKAIADELFVSPNTVKTHVTSLLNKLQVDSRVQLAAIATSRGLRHRGMTDAGS